MHITGVRRQWYLTGPEATQLVLDHEAQVRTVTDAILTATGLKDTAHGEITLVGGRFYSYRPAHRLQVLLPGFRVSRKAGDSGTAVLALRTTTGKLIRDQLAKVPKMPEAEDLTKALCGDPWCWISRFHPGAGSGTGMSLQAAPFGVERVGGHLYIVGFVGGLAPVGCTAVDDPHRAKSSEGDAP